MYSACKLNKQGDNIQPWRTPFPIWNQCYSMSRSNCCFLTWIQISQEAIQVGWYSHLLNFPQFVVIHTVKDFVVVNTAKVDVFLELSCFFNGPVDVGNLVSGSSAFSKTSLCGLLQIGETVSRFTAPNRDPRLCTLTEASLSLFPCCNEWTFLNINLK